MRSRIVLYKVKVLNNYDSTPMTLVAYFHVFKEKKFIYLRTSANIRVPEGTKKYMFRLSTNILFPIPIIENFNNDFLYCSSYSVGSVGGFA